MADPLDAAWPIQRTPRVPMRLIFLGTPAFAVPTLEKIVAAGHEVLTVVTQPDQPSGRGQLPAPPR